VEQLTQRSRWRGNAGLDDSNPVGIFLFVFIAPVASRFARRGSRLGF
jgi:hypothetical protein